MPLILICWGSYLLGSTLGDQVGWGVFCVSMGLSMHYNRD